MPQKCNLMSLVNTQLMQSLTTAQLTSTMLSETGVLEETVSHVLTNIAINAEEGNRFKLMHSQAIVAFMAGVEAIARALPSSTDDEKKNKTIKILSLVGIGPDGLINTAVQPIVDVGLKFPDLMAKYQPLVRNYVTNNNEQNGMLLANAARKLQMEIHQAIRLSLPQQRKPFAQAAPSAPGNPPGH